MAMIERVKEAPQGATPAAPGEQPQAVARRDKAVEACAEGYLSFLITAERFPKTPIPESLRTKIVDTASAVLHGR